MHKMLQMAAGVALPTIENDTRNFWLGAVGIRQDGVIITARNGIAAHSTKVKDYQLQPNSHAEGRALRKLGKYGTLYVARVLRKDNSYAMARPCKMCRTRLAAAKIDKVYYTIDNEHYGVWYPEEDVDKVFDV